MVIRRGTWLTESARKGREKEGIRRKSQRHRATSKIVSFSGKAEMNSKEGRLCIQEKSRVKLLVLRTKGSILLLEADKQFQWPLKNLGTHKPVI